MTDWEAEREKADGSFPRCPYCGDWVKIQASGNLSKSCGRTACKSALKRDTMKRVWGDEEMRKHLIELRFGRK
jgi:hypothetical protein